MNNLDKIASLKAEIDKLEREQALFESLSEDKQLAIALHDMKCTWNHTDGCGWYYEISNGSHNWTGHAHESWLNKAKELIKLCAWENVKVESALEILKLGKGF